MSEQRSTAIIRPGDYGGEGYEEVQYGHRFDCANEPGHEEHATYEDHNIVLPWRHLRGQAKDPHDLKRINNHPVVVVKRTITYTPWVDNGSTPTDGQS